jgi:7,8-dihydropterin-6-yl-methyl-4-(beta-D-ribofuranosyl)aminobenzene 5'-phosphate synthase
MSQHWMSSELAAPVRPGMEETPMTSPAALNPVDRVEILTVVDNICDLLLPSSNVARRMGAAALEGAGMPSLEAPLLASGRAVDAPIAEHGLSFLVSVT